MRDQNKPKMPSQDLDKSQRSRESVQRDGHKTTGKDQQQRNQKGNFVKNGLDE